MAVQLHSSYSGLHNSHAEETFGISNYEKNKKQIWIQQESSMTKCVLLWEMYKLMEDNDSLLGSNITNL